MDEVFIDASFWIAVSFPPDAHSGRALPFWELILQRDRPTVTTNWTLYEAATFLNGKRRRHDLAIELLDLADRTAQIVDASSLENEALGVFRSHSDKRWSVVDCANFVCIRERKSQYALSFDRDFSQAQSEFGFTLLGAPEST